MDYAHMSHAVYFYKQVVLSPYFNEFSAPYGCRQRPDQGDVYISVLICSPAAHPQHSISWCGGQSGEGDGGGQDGLGLASLDIIT
jgi:hypothetical protein